MILSYEELNKDVIKNIFNSDIRIARIIDEEGFYTKYFVTSNGKVISNNGKKLRILKLSETKTNYWIAHLSFGKKTKDYLIHRLVAEAFIPNPEDKPQVNHKDGDKSNNDISNLEWNTAKENMQHSYRTGLHKIGFGEESNNPKITEKTARKICKLLEENELTLDQIAAKCNTTRIIVTNIKHKDTWTWLSKDYCIDNHTVRSDGHVKMDSSIVHLICRDLEKNEETCMEIAEKYDVSYDQVSEIKQKKTWVKISKNYNIENHNLRPSSKKNRTKIKKICELLQDSEYSRQDIAKIVDCPLRLVDAILYKHSWMKVSDNYDFSKRYVRKKV